MVKAVNKLVMEINNTENPYFEKAILYIRPEMATSAKLDNNARGYINEIATGYFKKPEKTHTLLISVLASLMSAAITAVICVISF